MYNNLMYNHKCTANSSNINSNNTTMDSHSYMGSKDNLKASKMMAQVDIGVQLLILLTDASQPNLTTVDVGMLMVDMNMRLQISKLCLDTFSPSNQCAHHKDTTTYLVRCGAQLLLHHMVAFLEKRTDMSVGTLGLDKNIVHKILTLSADRVNYIHQFQLSLYDISISI